MASQPDSTSRMPDIGDYLGGIYEPGMSGVYKLRRGYGLHLLVGKETPHLGIRLMPVRVIVKPSSQFIAIADLEGRGQINPRFCHKRSYIFINVSPLWIV